MDLLDQIVRTAASRLGMKRRLHVIKRYHLWRYGHRVRLRQQFLSRWSAPEVRAMQDGYSIDLSQTKPHLQEMLQDADRIIREDRHPPPRHKHYLINHLDENALSQYRSFLDFATSDHMIAIAAGYLRLMPVLATIELWKTSVHSGGVVDSQLFHLDNADDTQVKAFVNLHDIDRANGPLVFLPRAVSQRVCTATRYGSVKGANRLTDDDVHAIAAPDELVIAKGPRGTIFFVDTANCLHYGSRRNTEPRYVLMCQYLSPCRADFRQSGLRQFLREADSETRRYLLDPQFGS